MPLSKPKPKHDKKPDPTAGIKSPEEARNLLATVQDLQFEVMELQKKIIPDIRKLVAEAGANTKDLIMKIAREHFDSRHERILASLFEFFCAEPVWETRFIHGAQTNKDEIEALYRQGFRYLCSTHDPATKIAGTMYHRPVMPKTVEEFIEIYTRASKARADEPKAIKAREEYYAQIASKHVASLKKVEPVDSPKTKKKPAIQKLAKK